jgi:hypothetical protein
MGLRMHVLHLWLPGCQLAAFLADIPLADIASQPRCALCTDAFDYTKKRGNKNAATP